MIFVNSFVVAEPSQPVRDCGTVVNHTGSTPLQWRLFSVGELEGAFVVSSTKHLNLLMPSVANFGSLSWMHVIHALPRAPPSPVPITPATRKTFSSSVSMRQLFQVSGSQPPGPVCEPRPTRPGSAMYWPQNEASPETAATAWFVGVCSSTPETEFPPGAMARPAAIW